MPHELPDLAARGQSQKIARVSQLPDSAVLPSGEKATE